MTARKSDQNGFITIEKNPISRAGILQYRGTSLPGGDPNRMYNVYRPEEELSDPETIASFKLIPIVNDHTMVGDGFTPAEDKGVHGSTGESVYFENGTLFSNLKVFSETLAGLIEDGKKHLSLGMRCKYEKVAGIFNGQAYDYIQRKLRGNHLALVDQSRCDVSVLDNHHAFDYAEVTISTIPNPEKIMADDANKGAEVKDNALEGAVTLESLAALIKDLAARVAAVETAKKEVAPVADAEGDVKDPEKPAAGDKKATDAEEDLKKAEKKEGEAMDAKEFKKLESKVDKFITGGTKAAVVEIAKRDALAAKLSPFIGVFDHSEKTLDEVAKYGAEKLGIKVEAGQEAIALDGFFVGRVAPHKAGSIALDGATKGTTGKAVDKFLSGKKA